jgi:hypothetical protein
MGAGRKEGIALKRRFLIWLSHRLPACDEVARLASERLDRRLGLRERLAMRLHLRLCAWCRRYLEQLELLHCAAPGLAGADAGPELPAAARERLERLLAGGGAAPERQ